MNITITRQHLGPTSLHGALATDVGFSCWTLERRLDDAAHAAIPAGTYALTLEPTHNARLWTPEPDRHLPRLHDVPGRSGILIHALNKSSESIGCVGVAFGREDDAVSQSRPALVALMALLRWSGGPHRITVVDIEP